MSNRKERRKMERDQKKEAAKKRETVQRGFVLKKEG